MTEAAAPVSPPRATPPIRRRRHWPFPVPTLEVRQVVGEREQVAVYVAALLLAALLSVGLLWLWGIAPRDLVNEIATTAFASPRALGSVLSLAAPLAIAGLATAIAFRANFWNIGLQGQMILGAIFAAFVAIHDLGPLALRLPLMAAAACLGGALWSLGPGLLRLRLGVSEVITTLLLNYVAFNLLLHLVYGPWKDPVTGFPHTQQFEASERLPQIGVLSQSLALPIAVGLALLLWWGMRVSRAGFLIDVTAGNPEMARALGVPVGALTLWAVIGSGAVGGLTGFVLTAGVAGRMTQDFFTGYLFLGVLIAFIARNHPGGVLLVAFLMAVLMQVGQSLQVFFGLPLAVVQLVQAVFIVAVAASDFPLRYRMHWRRGAGHG
jgi:simple sugar transport system permease protein